MSSVSFFVLSIHRTFACDEASGLRVSKPIQQGIFSERREKRSRYRFYLENTQKGEELLGSLWKKGEDDISIRKTEFKQGVGEPVAATLNIAERVIGPLKSLRNEAHRNPVLKTLVALLLRTDMADIELPVVNYLVVQTNHPLNDAYSRLKLKNYSMIATVKHQQIPGITIIEKAMILEYFMGFCATPG